MVQKNFAVVRAVKLRMSNCHVFQRPIQHVIPLEIRDDVEINGLKDNLDRVILQNYDSKSEDTNLPKRRSALVAQRKIEEQISQEAGEDVMN